MADSEYMPLRAEYGDSHLVPRVRTELYDLEADPDEVKNLSGQDELSSVEKRLAEELRQWMKATNDPALMGRIERPPHEVAHWSSFYNRPFRVSPDGTFEQFEAFCESWT